MAAAVRAVSGQKDWSQSSFGWGGAMIRLSPPQGRLWAPDKGQRQEQPLG